MARSHARNGKIARCPAAIRAEVNRRLDEGEKGPRLLTWLNSQEEVLRVLDEYFNEEPVSPQNLTEWRQGGYQEYLDRRDQLETTKGLADYSLELASRNGGNTTDGATAIAGGQLLMIFESLDVEAQKKLLTDKPGTYLGLVDALARLQKSQADAEKARQAKRLVAQNDRKLDQNERKLQLEEEKFQRATAEKFLKWYEDKRAAEIIAGGGKSEVKIEALRQLMFYGDEGVAPSP
ncbi:MAG TPA: hypothetical protein VL357_05815 [Rariglobus sp.]|jgi:hypothetical protein|nr:hypothetical protein [Rariglobus sp.]